MRRMGERKIEVDRAGLNIKPGGKSGACGQAISTSSGRQGMVEREGVVVSQVGFREKIGRRSRAP